MVARGEAELLEKLGVSVEDVTVETVEGTFLIEQVVPPCCERLAMLVLPEGIWLRRAGSQLPVKHVLDEVGVVADDELPPAEALAEKPREDDSEFLAWCALVFAGGNTDDDARPDFRREPEIDRLLHPLGQ